MSEDEILDLIHKAGLQANQRELDSLQQLTDIADQIAARQVATKMAEGEVPSGVGPIT